MEDFLETLFGGKAEEDYINLWEKVSPRDSHSTWHKTVNAAVEYGQIPRQHDIYVGVGTSGMSYGQGRRCKADQVTGIPGFWLDIDTKHEVHKKERLPENDEDIEKLLSVIPYLPTISINSGHGRQFWWIFDEFWHFASTDAHDRAAIMSRRFTELFRDRSKELGWGMDMTYDLARILRIPGTINYKSTPVPVETIFINGRRYNIEDIEDILPAVNSNTRGAPFTLPMDISTEDVVCEKFTLNKGANPPFDKLEMLRQSNPKFDASWEHRRKDFASGKDSGSEYDMSLAILAFQVNWTWQEVVDLLIAFRRLRGITLKVTDPNDPNSQLREKYYRDTLTKAAAITDEMRRKEEESSARKIDLGMKKLDLEQKKLERKEEGERKKIEKEERRDQKDAEMAELTLRKAVVQDTMAKMENIVDDALMLAEGERQRVLTDFIARVFRLPVTQITRKLGDPPMFELQLTSQIIRLGIVDNLTDQRLLRKKMDSMALHVAKFKPAEWEIIHKAIIGAMVTVEVSDDMTENGLVRTWVQMYLQEKNMQYDRHVAADSGNPYYEAGRVHILIRHMIPWLRDMQRISETFQHLGSMLTNAGFICMKPNIKISGSTSKHPYTTWSAYSLSADNELVLPFVDFDTATAADGAKG